MAKKRRSFEVFSLSFLDCICCGFGAMLLLFVLTIGKNSSAYQSIVSRIQEVISEVRIKIKTEEEVVGKVRARIVTTDERLSTEVAERDVKKQDLTELQDQLALILQQRSALQEQLEKLLAEKKDIPKEDETPPIPIPNTVRRQYLTGFNFEGNYMLFVVEASGGMLGNTVDEAIAYLSVTDEEKRKSLKWRRVIKSVQWIIANLRPDQVYQIIVFNNDVQLLIPESEGEWFEPLDRETTTKVVRALEQITPKGGANFERTFATMKTDFPSTDSVVLFTDSLPTQSDSFPVTTATDDRDRERLFRIALRELPRDTPINTILYPMSGDPAAAFLFWQLADNSGGSLISPAPSWPDI